MMYLWLDDLRDPAHHHCEGWTWAKTAEDAIKLLSTGEVEFASLDHDLGSVLDGHDVVCWMEEHDVWPSKGVVVHSGNTEGERQMLLALDKVYPHLVRFRRPFMIPSEKGFLANELAHSL
jgi:hypothetical protein